MESTLQSEPPAEEGFVMATCRTCKNRSDKMHSVFEVIDNCIVSEMLIALASIQISNDDNLPKSICKLCIEQLKNAYNFKLQCETVDASFRNYLDRCVKKENDAFANQTDPNPVSMDCLLPPDNNLMNKANESGQSSLLDSKSDKNVDFVEFHDDKVVFTCRECLKVYYSVESLRSHKQSAHLGYTYKCKDCNKEFSRSSSLRYHRQVHESRKSYSCRICKQSLTRLEHLKRHLLVHLKEKPFNCEQCQRGFTRQERLEMHLPKCTGVKGYICDICNKCCLREAGLIEHKKLHVNAKPTMLTMEDLKNYADYYDVYEDNVLSPLDKSTTEDAADSDSDGNEDVNLHGASDNEKPLDIILKEPNEYHDINDMLQTELEVKVEDETESDPIEQKMESDSDSDSDYAPKRNLDRSKTMLVRKMKQKKKLRRASKGFNKKIDELSEYKCSECQMVYKSLRKLEYHALEAHNGKRLHKCSVCGRDFIRLDHLTRHMMSHSDTKSFSCDICQKRFTRSDQVTKHKKIHSRIGSGDFACTICNKSYHRKDILNKHVLDKHNVSTEDKKFKCPMCDKSFVSEKYRDSHAKDHACDKEVACPTCSKTFPSKKHLSEHMRTHDENHKKFLCSECGQRFTRNNYLVIHMRRHRGEKPFKCQYCGKGFPRTTDLTVHEKYHTGDKKHLCTICGKGFIRAHSLTVHMRIHTGEKPYKCTYCEASFAQSNDLKSHTRRHTGERFQCEICAEKFLMGYLLNQHKRTVHGLIVETNCGRLKSKVERNPNELPPTNQIS